VTRRRPQTGRRQSISFSTVWHEWRLLKEKTSVYVVIPAKAGIQSLKIIGR
jgi:hypothetical protein